MNELTQIADAKIYFVMDRNEKFQIYKSTDQPGWPPSEQEMVSSPTAKVRALFNTMILGEALSHPKV